MNMNVENAINAAKTMPIASMTPIANMAQSAPSGGESSLAASAASKSGFSPEAVARGQVSSIASRQSDIMDSIGGLSALHGQISGLQGAMQASGPGAESARMMRDFLGQAQSKLGGAEIQNLNMIQTNNNVNLVFPNDGGGKAEGKPSATQGNPAQNASSNPADAAIADMAKSLKDLDAKTEKGFEAMMQKFEDLRKQLEEMMEEFRKMFEAMAEMQKAKQQQVSDLAKEAGFAPIPGMKPEVAEAIASALAHGDPTSQRRSDQNALKIGDSGDIQKTGPGSDPVQEKGDAASLGASETNGSTGGGGADASAGGQGGSGQKSAPAAAAA